MIVTLIRHTSVDVPPGMCYGQTDVPLRPSFPEEAALVGRKLEGGNFAAVYTSPLSRCVKLAAYCGFADARRDDRIKELHFGDWEMQYYDRINDPRLAAWYKDPMKVAATNGESFGQQYSRVAAFLDELKKSNPSPAALFTHGGTILCAQVYAGILNPAEAFRFLTPYGGIVKLEI